MQPGLPAALRLCTSKSPEGDGDKALLVEEQITPSQIYVLRQALKAGSGACR